MKYASLILLTLLCSPLAVAAPAVRAVQDEQAGSASELVARARAALEQGEIDAAWKLFEEAHAAGGGSLFTTIWLLRGRIARGHLNVALDGADELVANGKAGPGTSYVYGMALFERAKRYLADEVGPELIDLNFDDAVRYLQHATEKDPEQFGDAFLPLAEAAWLRQKNELARAAADKAVNRHPKGFDEALMLGRIAFSQFVIARGDPEGEARAEADWLTAMQAFEQAIENAGRPSDLDARNKLADAWLQKAYALIWKDQRAAAVTPFAEAMSIDPRVVDYRDIWTHLSAEQVVEALERGARAFAERNDEESILDATLLWWLGWAHFAEARYEQAEDAYMRAIRKFPAFADARWYVGLARYHRQDFDGAIAAMAAGFDRGPDEVIAAARTRLADNLAILDYLVGRIAGATTPRNLEAAALSELQAALDPEEARYLGNVGLFLYAAGKAIEPVDEAARAHRTDTFERALAAYGRALDVAPDDVSYLNDSAVVLQYGLQREFEEARSRYERVREISRRELAREDLAPEERVRIEQVDRDAEANLKALDA